MGCSRKFNLGSEVYDYLSPSPWSCVFLPMSRVRYPFPQELYDKFMGENEGDELTLRACALVCHAWLYTARTRLFSNLHLDEKSAKAFNAAYPIQHASFIRTLHIGCQDALWCLDDSPDITRALGTLASTPNTPYLRSLRVERISLRPSQDAGSGDLAALHSFAHISKLEILSGDLHSWPSALELLEGFQNLKSLSIGKKVSMFRPGEPNDHPDACQVAFAWEEVEVGYTQLPLLGYIHSVAAGGLSSIRKVVLHGWEISCSQQPNVESMIGAWTSTVEDLTIIFAPWSSANFQGK